MFTIFENGNVIWTVGSILHRSDGPAVEYLDGSQEWFLNGKRHREDGPAVIYIRYNVKEWWVKGTKVDCSSQEEFTKLCKLKAFW